MFYELVKVAHIVAMVTWMSGMVAMALFLSMAVTDGLGGIQVWDRRITTPAMLFTWILGLSLAVTASWFGAAWLWAKLAPVTLLSGVHGVLTGRLRRAMGRGGGAPDPVARLCLGATFILVTATALLVVTQPF